MQKRQPHIKKGGDFKDLVTKSTIFADKTLLIKEVIDDHATVIWITMPQRWGKSVNLDMLKRFLERPVAEKGHILDDHTTTHNYKLFAGGEINIKDGFIVKQIKTLPLKISHIPTVWNRFGQFPVISIDLSQCKGENTVTVQEKIKMELRKCFQQHHYLQTSIHLDPLDKQEIHRYTGTMSSRRLGDQQIRKGLRFLSEMLYRHYDQKVWIFVDEYDTIFNNPYKIWSGDITTQMLYSLFKEIYTMTLKDNPYLEKAILTGSHYVVQSDLLADIDHVMRYSLTDYKYAQYYGLEQEEINEFVQHFNLDDAKVKQLETWYGGYKIHQSNGDKYHTDRIVKKYNTWSVINYLNNHDSVAKSYLEPSRYFDFIRKIFKHPQIEEKVRRLLKNGEICFKRIEKFSIHHLKALRAMISLGDHHEITEDGFRVLCSYLFKIGYLTLGTEHDCYVLPNHEIKYELSKEVVQYYRRKYNIDHRKVIEITNTLDRVFGRTSDYMKEEKYTDEKKYIREILCNQFRSQFEGLIKEWKILHKNSKETEGIIGNKDVMQSVLSCITSHPVYTIFGTSIYTKKNHSDALGRTGILLKRKGKGMIVEVTYDSDAKTALNQAKDSESLTKDLSKQIYVGINISSKKEVTLEVELRVSEQDDYHV